MMRMITKKNVGIVVCVIAVGWYSVFAFNKVEQSDGVEYREEIKSLKSDLEVAKTWIQTLNSEGEENLSRWHEFQNRAEPDTMCALFDEFLVEVTEHRKQNSSMPECLTDDKDNDNGPDVW